MFINDAGISLIKSREGCQLAAYKDQGGVLSIGYGHTGREVTEGLTCTQDQADNWFNQDIRNTCATLTRLITVSLNENQFAALVSLAYNIGIGHFTDSTLLKVLNNGWFEQVPVQIARWNHVNGVVSDGLTKRRADEVRLWNKPFVDVT